MAMAAVRPLKAKTQADGPVAVPSPPSLADRIAEAQHAAKGPRQRVGELERALKDARDREDYPAAAELKDKLTTARQEAAITDAAVLGLQTALAEVERQAAEDNRVLQEQQQRTAAQQRLAEMQQLEQERLAELHAEIAALWSGLEAVKRTYLRALELQFQAGQARAGVHQARVQLGEAQPGRISPPNFASVLPDAYPVIRALAQWRR